MVAGWSGLEALVAGLAALVAGLIALVAGLRAVDVGVAGLVAGLAALVAGLAVLPLFVEQALRVTAMLAATPTVSSGGLFIGVFLQSCGLRVRLHRRVRGR